MKLWRDKIILRGGEVILPEQVCRLEKDRGSWKVSYFSDRYDGFRTVPIFGAKIERCIDVEET